jgi:superfamily II DNA or RNA helicase
MTESFVAPNFLTEVGPRGLTRQLERLLAHLGFTDITSIDGPGDEGGDLIATRGGIRWVFQSKWKKTGTVKSGAVDEVFGALSFYRADRAVVVTNQRFGPSARERARELSRLGPRIVLWEGRDLVDSYDRLATERLPERTLRPYQARAFEALSESLASTDRALVILATGLGKTVVGGEVIARHLADKPEGQVLIVAHQKSLVEQLERAMWHHLPKTVRTQLLTEDERTSDLHGVTCATVASALTYVRGGYRPTLVMVDEAHHVAESGQFADLLTEIDSVPRFGVTATPWRGDRFDIQQWFGEPSFTLGIEEGMRLGYLADTRYRLFADNIDWDFVREMSEHGYTIKDLNARLFLPDRDEAVRDELIDVWAQVRQPRAIVFCRGIEHAERMAGVLDGIPQWKGAMALHAELPKREQQQRLLRFRTGEIPILTAVDILNEGVDVPDVNIIVFARVTHSRRIFVQQLGRGLRLRTGKTHVEVLDFVSDIRRVAAVMNMREQVGADEVETLRISGRNSFEFTDQRAESLMKEWIADAASLETELDEARLQFPDLSAGG